MRDTSRAENDFDLHFASLPERPQGFHPDNPGHPVIDHLFRGQDEQDFQDEEKAFSHAKTQRLTRTRDMSLETMFRFCFTLCGLASLREILGFEGHLVAIPL
ncbi:MAG: hypothetical protein ACRC8S_17980 [Fimbriiglobus sp.]